MTKKYYNITFTENEVFGLICALNVSIDHIRTCENRLNSIMAKNFDDLSKKITDQIIIIESEKK